MSIFLLYCFYLHQSTRMTKLKSLSPPILVCKKIGRLSHRQQTQTIIIIIKSMLWIVPLHKYMGPTSRQQCPPHILYLLQAFYRVQVHYEPGMFLHRICIRIAYALTFIQGVEDVIIMPSLLYDFCFCVDLPRYRTLWHIWDGLWSEFK